MCCRSNQTPNHTLGVNLKKEQARPPGPVGAVFNSAGSSLKTTSSGLRGLKRIFSYINASCHLFILTAKQ